MHLSDASNSVIQKVHFSSEKRDGFTVKDIQLLKFQVKDALESSMFLADSVVIGQTKIFYRIGLFVKLIVVDAVRFPAACIGFQRREAITAAGHHSHALVGDVVSNLELEFSATADTEVVNNAEQQ